MNFDKIPKNGVFGLLFGVERPNRRGRGRGSFTSEGGFTSSVIPKYVRKVQGDKLDHKVDLHSYHS